MGDEPTPPNNALIEYRLSELKGMCSDILSRMDDHLAAFNNHVREDTILAEQVKQVMEERKSNAGIWSGIGGALAGVGAFLYSLFGSK